MLPALSFCCEFIFFSFIFMYPIINPIFRATWASICCWVLFYSNTVLLVFLCFCPQGGVFWFFCVFRFFSIYIPPSYVLPPSLLSFLCYLFWNFDSLYCRFFSTSWYCQVSCFPESASPFLLHDDLYFRFLVLSYVVEGGWGGGGGRRVQSHVSLYQQALFYFTTTLTFVFWSSLMWWRGEGGGHMVTHFSSNL